MKLIVTEGESAANSTDNASPFIRNTESIETTTENLTTKN